MARLLIVDDEPSIRRIIQLMLKNSGHELFTASNGREAMQILNKEPIDLILLDVVMPEQGGLETIMQIRNGYPDVKLIIISGKVPVDNDAFRNLIEQYGVARVFDKPFEKEDIMQAIDELLAVT
jgi:CheY-like chemotaxis protein